MLTSKITIHDRANAEGLHPVRLRLTKDRKVAYLLTGVWIKWKDWNPKGSSDKANWIRSSEHLHPQYNHALNKLLGKAKTIAATEPELSLQQVKDRLSGKEASGNFLDFYLQEVDRKKPVYNTWKKYNSCYQHLHDFTGGALPYSGFTVKLLKDYQAARLAKGVTQTTVATELSNFRTVLKQARAEGVTTVNPFEYFRYDAGKGKPKQKLSQKEIDTLATAEATGWEHLARVAWLIQFYMVGSRIADVLLLRRNQIHSGRVYYQMDKTGAAKSVKVSPQLQALIDPYLSGPADGLLLPLLSESDFGGTETKLKKAMGSKTALINKYLKKLYQRLKIKKHVTTHVSRHSFASIGQDKLKDVRTMQQLLGHKKLSTTQIYLDQLNQEQHDTATDSIYDTEAG